MVASKSLKSLLYQQATQIVCRREKRELREEIGQEYRRLLYRSQMQKADEKTISRIKTMKMHLPPARSMGEAYVSNHVRGILEDYIKKRKYHPITLKEIEKYTKIGKWPDSILGENPNA